MIKKTIIGSVIFLATFLIGYFAVLPLLREPSTIDPVALESTPVAVDIENMPPVKNPDFDAEYDPGNDNNKRPRINTQIKLLWVSDFHSEDFPYKSGNGWLGLFKSGDTFSLKQTKISVRKISNPELFDLTVTTEQQGESIFLVKGASYLRESPIMTVYQRGDGESQDHELRDETRTFEFKGLIYELKVENLDDGGYLTIGSQLILEAGGNRQTLRYLKRGCNDCSWSVNWAGDLDLDGRLDFYMNLTDHYNVEDRVLFLSSRAEGNKLVKFVGSFYSVGC